VRADTNTASATSGATHGCAGAQQVALVVHPQALRDIGDRVGDRNATSVGIARIEHDDGQVRAPEFVACAAHAFAFDGVAAFAQARGVHEGEFGAVHAQRFRAGDRAWCPRCP
jgi:hypothetical protein